MDHTQSSWQPRAPRAAAPCPGASPRVARWAAGHGVVRVLGGAAMLLAGCSAEPAGPAAQAPNPPPTRAEKPEAEAAPACDDADLVASLARVSGVRDVAEISCGSYVRGAARCFSLTFTQWHDHRLRERAGELLQSARLIHRGCDRPTTVMDNGYALPPGPYDLEPSLAFQTNVLDLEHRYQGKSTPKVKNWSYLSAENAAADLHEVIVAFRAFYPGRWVTTGASKGGITAIYHRFSFPNDVDGTIAYVAPASRAREDARYQEWMDAAPQPKRCKEDLRAFQVAALTTRRAQFSAAVARRHPGSPVDAEYLLERIVAPYDWGFWQYSGACSDVPSPDASDEAHSAYFEAILDMEEGSGAPAPAGVTHVPALAYEWSWQHGFAEQVGSHVARHLRTSALADSRNERAFTAAFPDVPLPAYDGTLTARANDWVRASAERVLLVYGELDPWSGRALDAPTRPSSGRYFAPGRAHDAQMWHLPKAERTAAMALAAAMYGGSATRSFDAAVGADLHREHLNRQRAALAYMAQPWRARPAE